MRFYNGQPVVCINDNFSWARRMYPFTDIVYPVRGQRYVVRGYVNITVSHRANAPALLVVGITNPRVRYVNGEMHEAGFAEHRFAPITEEQVKSIIEEAHCVPATEKEDA